MQNDLISIEPQVIQFNRQNSQTIKVTNNTSNPLNNFFFCLYNVQKFTFKPQTFSLLPKQHKLIEITLKIKTTKSVAKQFAYLKSTQVNKRLTLLINNFNSPQVRTRQIEQISDNMNTLSSRDYHQLHNRALNKIIGEQHRLVDINSLNSNQNIVRQFNRTQNFSIGSSGSTGKKDYFNNNRTAGKQQQQYYHQKSSISRKHHHHFDNDQKDQQYIREIQKKNNQLQKQVEELNQIVSRGNFQLQKIQHQNRFLSQQGSKLMKKISQKQTRIKELQSLYQKIVQQNTSFSTEVQQLKQQIDRQRQSSKQTSKSKQQLNLLYKNYQSRIKQLQQVVESSQRNSINKFSEEFRKNIQQKDKQLNEIRKSLQHQQLLVKQHQINLMKVQGENKLLKDKKNKLQLQNSQLIELNNNLKEQIFVYKSRVDQGSSNNTKLQQYLQIALQSYKTQNQNLKKSKFQLQKSLQGIINTNRQTQSQNSHMQQKIDTLTNQLNKLQQQLHKQQSIKQQLKAQHHQKIKQLTQKNILLLENLTQQNNTKRQSQIHAKQLQIKSICEQKQRQKHQLIDQINKLQKENQKISQLEEQNAQLEEKVKKYKKQTRKQLKSINDNAFDQLRRIHDEKKTLQKKVMKLQKIVFKLQSNQHNNQNPNNRTSYLVGENNSKNQHLAGTSDINSKSQINYSKLQLDERLRFNNNTNRLEEDQEQSDSNIVSNSNRDNIQSSSNNVRSKSQYQTTGNHHIINRKTGIFNQRHQLYDSRSASMKNALISPHNQTTNQSPNYQLFQLRQFSAFVHNQQQRFQYMFNLQSQLMDPLDYQGKPLNNIKPLYKAIKFFKVIQNKLKNMTQKAQQSLILNKQNTFIKQKLLQYEKGQQNQQQQRYDTNKKDISQITVQNPMMMMRIQQEQGPSFLLNRTNLTNLNAFQMIQFLKGQMKKQYNKQLENIKFIEEKHQILKKKIYREYRTRIVQLINQNQYNKKSNNQNSNNAVTINKLQNLIERFVQGLSNLSHKQAVLNKEIKIKNTYKHQNTKLKQKLNQFQHLLNEKQHGYCNRDPVKVFNCSTFINNNPTIREQQWMESIKLSAQLLTQKAQSQRLKQQLDIIRQDYSQLKQQLNQLIIKNDTKDNEIIKLKKNQLELQRDYEKQLQKQNQILEETKSKLTSSANTKTKTKTITRLQEKLKDKQKQIELLRTQIEKKNLLLRTYKQKQKKWEQQKIQTNRQQQKEKSLASSYRRIEQNNMLIKQSNRQLRQQNNQLKDMIEKLEKQLQKKKIYIKNLKAQEDQTRITKPLRIQQTQSLIKQLEDALNKTKQELSQLKKQKQKDINKLQNDLLSTKNQSLIHIRSLESVLRATLDAVKKIFASFKIFAKKKGISISAQQYELNLPQNLLSVNAAQIYQQFQQILQLLDN